MRHPTLLLALAALLSRALCSVADIYVEPVSLSAGGPVPLAQVRYDAAAPDEAEVIAFELPESLAPASSAADEQPRLLLRVGAYDAAAGAWVGATSVAAAANLGKGYAPTLVLSVAGSGRVLGAALRGVRIDAGATRDFGPKAVVVVERLGKQVAVNKPVLLTDIGKGPEPEKSLLQKYWWVVGIIIVALMSGGGGGDSK